MEDPTFTSPTSRNANTSPTSNKFVFTLNNYTESEVQRIENYPDWVRWIGYGKEVAPSTGTPHLQGFVYTWDACRKTKFKLFLKRAHVEVQLGSFEQNEMYCNKDKDWKEFGERPQQGRRNDILGVKRRLDQGVPLSELVENESFFSTVMRNERSLAKYELQQQIKRMRKEGHKPPEVYIRIGPTRSGKTSFVYKTHGYDKVYSVADVTGAWHDGYAGEPVLLYDDVDCTRCPKIEYFKKITDGHPERYPIKGGYVAIRPTHIYLTSNHQPKDWWKGIDASDWNAIKERITEVRLVYKDKPDVVIYSKNGRQEEAILDRIEQAPEDGENVDEEVLREEESD